MFSDELLELTAEYGEAFLGTPTTTYLNPECHNVPLHRCNDVSKATLFDGGGPHPASKISLRCPRCGSIYGYDKYGSKFRNGQHYYSHAKEYI